MHLQALTAKREDEEVPIAEQLREPKLAEQMLELQARSLTALNTASATLCLAQPRSKRLRS